MVRGFLGGSDSKESACNAGDPGSIPGLGRSPREGNGYPLQHSCLEKPYTEESLVKLQYMGRIESDMTAHDIRLSLTSLSPIISMFINDAANGIISFSFYD